MELRLSSPAARLSPGAPWAAPVSAGPVRASLRVPGSKSATNRALLLAALADGTSRLERPLRSRDTMLMARALRALGVDVVDEGTDESPDAAWVVTGQPVPHELTPAATVDVGNAGTVARFLPPAAAVLTRGVVHVDGDPRMRERPLGPLLQALAAAGVRLDDAGRGAVPFDLHATGRVAGGSATVDASSSSQLVSGLLLSAPRFDAGIVVHHDGPPVPSAPHLRMTTSMLREHGATVVEPDEDAVGKLTWVVQPGRLHPVDRLIEPDLSSASAFLAAAAATGGEVVLEGWPAGTEQPGRLLPGLLEAFGCSCLVAGGHLTVRGPDRLSGADLDLHSYGEAAPTLCALAVLAEGPSRLRGIAHLRLQETDRLAALAHELGLLGARVEVTEDGLAVTPAPLHGGVLDPHADHRLAMAFAVVGLAVPGVEVREISTVAKTVPDFPERWAGLLR